MRPSNSTHPGPRRPQTAAATTERRDAQTGRLTWRPGNPSTASTNTGLSHLGLGQDRDGLVYVPDGYNPDRPMGLAVMLHTAGGTAPHGMAPFIDRADTGNLLPLAPESRGRTWDIILGAYGRTTSSSTWR